ncbi:MAG TPA: hypothetical protein GXZ48_00845 [Acholeplasmataceae bacterium]|nr:hypothetical protein [Acholeplasmataceae bacterium]
MRKFLLLVFLLLLVGCSDKTNPVEKDIIIPDRIEIVNLSGNNEITVGENTISLEFVTYPTSASQDIIWSSSDDLIATVDDEGVVTGIDNGTVIIKAASAHDETVYDEYEIIVYNDLPSYETIEEIISFLEDTIPSEATTGDLNIPFFYDGNIRLTWSSSDENTISRIGKVSSAKTDKDVTLEATFKVGRIQGKFTKTIHVPRYELKSRDEKKLTFTYLYDSWGYNGIREGDLDKIDVINLSFGGIVNGKLSVSGMPNRAQIVNEAHEAGTRVVLAIGGWGVDGFSQAVRTKASRKIFIDSIIEGIEKYRFDGIDIDWEYPTSTASGLIEAHPSDKVNLTYFMEDLRAAMDKVDEDLILSIAVAAGSWAADNYYEVSKLNNIIDFMHVMTYDMVDYGTPITTHHTNLYTSQYKTGSSADLAVKAYINRGMDSEKVIMGVAFYGHTFVTTDNNGNGMGKNTVKEGNAFKHSSITYKNLVNNYLNNPLYKVYYDETAKAYWLFGDSFFISYESPESIAEKAKYAINNNLGGLMVWEYNQDDEASTLLNAIYNNLYK